MASPSDIVNRFTYHPPKDGQNEIYNKIRAAAGNLAILINDNTPECREQSLALTSLEEAVFWANAGVARHT